MRHSTLFEATSINGMNLANRFVRSATWEGLADKEVFYREPAKAYKQEVSIPIPAGSGSSACGVASD